MSDAFWAALFTAAPVVLGIWLAHKRQMASIAANTDETVKGQRAVYQKLDSAEKNVADQITTTGAEVKKEALQTAKATAVIAMQTAASARNASKEVLEQLGPIAEKLNGGPNGLSTLTSRVTSLEGQMGTIQGQMDIVVKGQSDMIRSMDHFADVLERKHG